MTILQLEARTGLPRASIRYYESEKLLHPKRLANGYRDYSEEDAAALEKIALLRRLEVSIEDLRQLLCGTVPLELVLERQEAQLLRDAQQNLLARQLCRTMRQDKVSFSGLEPERYRTLLAAPEQTSQPLLPQTPETQQAASAASCPWRRWLARTLDMTLYCVPWMLLCGYVLRFSPSSNAYRAVLTVMTMVNALLFEPVLLCTWGTTPGKWLLGLQLRSEHNWGCTKLSWGEAFLRCARLLFYGYGLNVPLVSLYCLYRAKKTAGKGEEQPWDEDVVYTVTETAGWRRAAYACVLGLTVAGLCFSLQYAQLPRIRGELTAEQYVSNVNELMRYHFQTNSFVLQSDGQWLRQKGSSGQPAVWWLYKASETANMRQEIQVEDGRVTGVTVTIPLQASEISIHNGAVQKEIAVLALVGADQSVPVSQLFDLCDVIADQGTYTVTAGDWQVSQTVNGDGFTYMAPYWISVSQLSQTTAAPGSDTAQAVFCIEKVK